jgi:hypothetical protein
MNLVDNSVKPFFDAIHDIEDKNRGGCLFFCYAFWKWLKKNGYPTDSFQIVQYDNDNERIMQNIKWIENNRGISQDFENSGNPLSSSHFSWLYQDVEYDGNGHISKTRWVGYAKKTLFGLNTPNLNVDLVEQFCVGALTKSFWNDDFDRKGAIDDLVYSLGVNLYDVDDGRY